MLDGRAGGIIFCQTKMNYLRISLGFWFGSHALVQSPPKNPEDKNYPKHPHTPSQVKARAEHDSI
jgi:hypothetical protein